MVETLDLQNRVKQYFSKAWGLALVEGLLAVGVGLLLMFRPAATIVFLVQVLGVYWFFSGIFKSIASFTGIKEKGWWMRLAGGILLAALGVFVLTYPLYSAAVTVATLTFLVASMAVLGGVMAVIWGFSAAATIPGEGWTIVSGMLSIILGMVLFTAPYVSLQGLTFLAALLAIASGIGQVIFSFRMRDFSRRVSRIDTRHFVPR